MEQHFQIRRMSSPAETEFRERHPYADGVYVDRHGNAWIGRVHLNKTPEGRIRDHAVLPHLHRDTGGYVPAPADWQPRIIRELPGIGLEC